METAGEGFIPSLRYCASFHDHVVKALTILNYPICGTFFLTFFPKNLLLDVSAMNPVSVLGSKDAE